MKRWIVLLALLVSVRVTAAQKTGFASVEPLSKNAYLVYGSGLAVRLQEHGYLEAFLQVADAGKELQVRSLSYTGDQVHYRLRPAKFGAHLNRLLGAWKGTHILLLFGQNESFVGIERLAEFEKNLGDYLAVIQGRHPGAKLTLIAPIAAEEVDDPSLPGVGARNQVLARYTEAMRTFAASEKIGFVDLFDISRRLYAEEDVALTLDGLYLNDHGNFLVGRALANALHPKADFSDVDPASPWFRQLLDTVKRKTYHVAETYRPSNGVHYYSVRARAYEYEAEVPHHMHLSKQLDRRIWRLAANPGTVLEQVDLPSRQAEPPSKGGRRGTGVMKSVKEDLAEFEVAPDYAIDCFASNETFPELINPMQVHAGPKGRIWVSTFSSYPIPVPGTRADDKILIFEDTDGDGKADQRTVFADNLLLPDGFVFYRDGVIVSVPRKLIWLRDTDGDDRADQTVELLCGIDDTDTHHGGFLATTPNGRITFCEGVFHRTQIETPWGVVHSKDATALNFDPRTRRVTVERQTKAPNPWKITHNSWGAGYQMFGGGQTIDVDYYTLGMPAGSKPMDAGGLFRHDKGCAMAAVSSAHFPEAWQDGVVTGHLLGRNTVIYTPLKQTNGKYRQEGEAVDLLNSPNKAFRPVDLCFGLDGALYISDLYYPIIGHAQHSVRDKNRDYTHGRIWRLTRKGVPLLAPPDIAGGSVATLLGLLTHPQVRVRELARVELGCHSTSAVLQAMKAWLPAVAEDDGTSQRKRMEALWVYERRSIDDPSVLRQLLASSASQARAVGARSLRHWGKALGREAFELARKALADEGPRVRIGAISSISFLQWEDPDWRTLLAEHVEPKGSWLVAMVDRASVAPKPLMKPVVPILAARADTRLKGWDVKGNEGTISFRATRDMEVRMGTRGNPNINIDLNDLPVIRGTGNNFSSDFQSRAPVRKGFNKIRYFVSGAPQTGKKRRRKPSVHVSLSDLAGAKPRGVIYPKNTEEARKWAAAYDKVYATVGEDHIYLRTVPGQLQFNVNAFTVQAGKTYRFLLENTDIIMHNFILARPGKEAEVGKLADTLAATPDGLKKHYIPDSDLVLFATKQVPAGETLEKTFTVPSDPGDYPFICSFPGHWQIMRGTMTVK